MTKFLLWFAIMGKLQETAKRLTASQRRELLVAAALKVMRTDGVAAATTRAICNEAGMPQSAFHYCFHTKKDLYRALLATEIDFDLDGIWPSAIAGTNLEARVSSIMLAWWGAIEAEPNSQLVLFELSDLALRDPELQDLAQWEQQAALKKATQAIDRVVSETGVKLDPPLEELAEMVIAALDGVARSWLRHRDNKRARQTITNFAAAITAFATK